MAGNFRGVLIFVIFVVDLAVTKFSHPRKLIPMVLCESMMMVVATNIMANISIILCSSQLVQRCI